MTLAPRDDFVPSQKAGAHPVLAGAPALNPQLVVPAKIPTARVLCRPQRRIA